MPAVSISSSSSHQLHYFSNDLIPLHSLPIIQFPQKGQDANPSFDISNECSARISAKAGHQCLKWRARVSFFQSFSTKNRDVETLKQELLGAVAPLDRGAEATPEDQERVDEIARKLESVNKVKEPLKSSLLNGKWELLHTASKSILQPQRPKLLRPNGKIYQAINVDTLRAQNMETWPFLNQDVPGKMQCNICHSDGAVPAGAPFWGG